AGAGGRAPPVNPGVSVAEARGSTKSVKTTSASPPARRMRPDSAGRALCPAPSAEGGLLVLQHGEDLLAELGAVDVAMRRHGVLSGRLQHLHLGARDRERAVVLARELPAV